MPPLSTDSISQIQTISVSSDYPSGIAAASVPSRRGIVVVLAGFVAAVAYCSWPIGLVVNPVLVATGLASDLEAHGQPFYWLFILLDCVTGAATFIAARYAWPGRSATNFRLSRLSLAFYVLFGTATAVDALIPVGCGTASLASCGADLSSLNLDDMLTGLAVFALFAAAVAAQVCFVRDRRWNAYSIASLGLIVVWSALGLYYLAHHFSAQPAVLVQHLMLTLTSVIAFITMLVTWTQPHLRSHHPVNYPAEFGSGADLS